MHKIKLSLELTLTDDAFNAIVDNVVALEGETVSDIIKREFVSFYGSDSPDSKLLSCDVEVSHA